MKIDLGLKDYFNFSSHSAYGSNLTTWLKLLWKFKGEIDWQFYPKVAFITCAVLFNTPFIWLEKLRFRNAMKDVKLADPVFILGHPRSGTTYLHYLLSKDPQFAYCSIYESFMPWIFLSAGSFLRRLMKMVLPETRPMDNVKLHADAPKEEEFGLGCMGVQSIVTGYVFPRKMLDIFRRYVLLIADSDKKAWQENLVYFMKKLSLKYSSKPLLMKSPSNTARIGSILEIFPKAKFIHIYRNPYVVYPSTKRLYEKTLPLMALQHVSENEFDDAIIKSYTEMFEQYFEDRKLVPDGNLVEIAYEKFVGNEMELLQSAYAELGLKGWEIAAPLVDKEIRKQAGYKTNEYEPSEAMMEKIYHNWKSVFDAFGYDK